jgi:mono/diheme cytochrome c family protein
MRERLALGLASLTGFLVVVLAIGFALVQTAPERPIEEAIVAPLEEPEVAPRVAEGRAVYAAQNCARCHAIAGRGNPRFPLDGVGARRDRDGLRAWITAPPEMADQMSSRAFSAKQPYQNLPEDELEALIDYLATLRDG